MSRSYSSSRTLASARLDASSRKAIANIPYSVNIKSVVPDRLKMTGNASYISNISSNFSVFAILRMHSGLPAANTVWGAITGTSARNSFISVTNSGALSAGYGYTTGNQLITHTQVLSSFRWYLVGLMYQNPGNLSVVVNNVIQSVAVTNPINTTIQDQYIGNSNATFNPSLDVCWFRIFNSVLTQSDVDKIYYSWGSNVSPSLTSVCSINFNQGTGTTATDSSGNGNNFTFQGSPSWSTETPTMLRIAV